MDRDHWRELGRAKSGFNLHGDSILASFFVGIWEGLTDIWDFAGRRIGLRHRLRNNSAHSKNDQAVFYGTATQLAAMVAAADGRVEVREFEHFKASLGGFDDIVPNAQALFNEQVRRPKSLLNILSDFLQAFGHSSPAAESLLIALCAAATADGNACGKEIKVIRITGEMLGLRYDTINRIFATAGISISTRHDDTQFYWQDANTHGTRATGMSERDRHFAMLGLKPGAAAQDIKAAYRKLTKTYHPDRLIGQGVPETEIARAEAMMVKINGAYDALTA